MPTTATPPIDLVVFDLGGVLVRAARSFEEACVIAGRPDLPLLRDADFLAAHLEIISAYMLGRTSTEDYDAAVAEASGGLLSPAEAHRILRAWCVEEYPGVAGVLEQIEACGVRTAVLSNTNAAHWELVADGPTAREAYPAIARTHEQFASHLLGLAKPDRAIFAAVEARTGVEASRILFFDDVAANVEGARAAGWHAEQIDHLQPSTAPQLLAHLRAYAVIA
jgi:HAD superfamily hydrolase (TIGR01509 family)